MALNIKARLRGDKALVNVLKRLGKDAPNALAKALFKEGEQIMAKSKRLVPVDTGALRASGHVQPPVIVGKKVSVTLGYGGAAAPYAVFVHEKPARHNPPTQWKYLETPLNEAIPTMARRLAIRMRPRDPKTGKFL